MKEKYTFTRMLYILLQVVWYLQLLFLAILIIVFALIYFENPLVDQFKLKGFRVQFERIDINDNAAESVYLSNGEGRLHDIKTEDKFIFLRLLSVFVDALLYLFIIYRLKNIFKALKLDNFFIRQNGIYMKHIAYAVLGIALLPSLIDYTINLKVLESIHIKGIVFKAGFHFDFRTLFLAILIFVIAQGFIRGAEIKEENDLTI